MKAILCLLILGSNSITSDAILSWLLGGKNDKKCADPPACAGGSRYRNFDGSCNNVNDPGAGMAGMPYGRLCEDSYCNDKSGFPKSKSGKPLPNARRISFTLYPEKPNDDYKCTQLVQTFGQFLTHDMVMAAGVGQINRHLISCCDKDKNILTKLLADPRCAAILITEDDPVYDSDETRCLQLARTFNTNDKNCHSPYDSYTPISDVTPWIDGSMMYSNSADDVKKLREYKYGRLSAVIRNNQEWPPQHSKPAEVCSGQATSEPCYLTGDIRANQSPQLAQLHIIFFREHNRICKELLILNPNWDDEKTFQEARRIVIAMIQHITFNAYLEIILGRDAAVEYKLMHPDILGYVKDYDSDRKPYVYIEFAAAAFRFYHSMIHGRVDLCDEDRTTTNSIDLRDSFNGAGMLEQSDNFLGFCLGSSTQSVRMSDQFHDVAVTQYLFGGKNKLGSDLRALDTQRSRDQGTCTYVNIRKECNLFVPTNLDDLRLCDISEENVDKLKGLYESIDDVELVVVGPLEQVLPGARAGPTISCVIAKQFFNSRASDKHFYQNGDETTSFKEDQLSSIILGTSMSGLMCSNVEGVKTMQPNAFLKISPENPLKSCDEIPRVDLRPWKDSN